MFLWVFSVPTLIGKKVRVIPRTRQTLAIFEPITSPMEREGTFWIIEEMVTESSGIDVPKATTVAPTIRGESLKTALIFLAWLTRKLAEKTRPIKLAVKII